MVGVSKKVYQKELARTQELLRLVMLNIEAVDKENTKIRERLAEVKRLLK